MICLFVVPNKLTSKCRTLKVFGFLIFKTFNLYYAFEFSKLTSHDQLFVALPRVSAKILKGDATYVGVPYD